MLLWNQIDDSQLFSSLFWHQKEEVDFPQPWKWDYTMIWLVVKGKLIVELWEPPCVSVTAYHSILGCNGTKHREEIHPDVVKYPRERLRQFIKTNSAIDEYECCIPQPRQLPFTGFQQSSISSRELHCHVSRNLRTSREASNGKWWHSSHAYERPSSLNGGKIVDSYQDVARFFFYTPT